MKYKSYNDGVDHINIYSQGKTLLGRALSNFTPCNLHTEDGEFDSIEGYWFWILNKDNPLSENLRSMYGAQAKQYGRQLSNSDWPNTLNLESFKDKIKKAMRNKIEQNEVIKDMFVKSELPFIHCYVNSATGEYIKVKGCKWICDFWGVLREELKNGQ